MAQACAAGHSQRVLPLRHDQMEEMSDIFHPAFVYCYAPRSLPDNPASILETDKSRCLMMSKLVKEMYSKMLM